MPQQMNPNENYRQPLRPSELQAYIQQGLLTIEEALRLADWYLFGTGSKSAYSLARLSIVVNRSTKTDHQ